MLIGPDAVDGLDFEAIETAERRRALGVAALSVEQRLNADRSDHRALPAVLFGQLPRWPHPFQERLRIQTPYGLCLETQHFPDLPNHATSPPPFSGPGRPLFSGTLPGPFSESVHPPGQSRWVVIFAERPNSERVGICLGRERVLRVDQSAPGIIATDPHLAHVQGKAGEIPPDDVHGMLGSASLERQVLGPVREGGKPEKGLTADEKSHAVLITDRHPARVGPRPEFLRSHVRANLAHTRGLIKPHEGCRLPVPIIFLGPSAKPLDPVESPGHGQPHSKPGQLGQFTAGTRGEIVGYDEHRTINKYAIE